MVHNFVVHKFVYHFFIDVTKYGIFLEDPVFKLWMNR